MKILHIVNSLSCGGLEKMVVELASSTINKGIQPTIACLIPDGELVALAKDKGLKVFSFVKGNGFDITLIWKIANVLRRERFDIVHTHNMAPLIYGTLAVKLFGLKTKLINTRHGREAKSTLSFVWACNDTVVPISNDAKRRLLQYNRVDGNKIRVIYNGVSFDDFRILPNPELLEIKSEFAISPEIKIIGTVARLSSEKDQMTLLESFSEVHRQDPETLLMLVGAGPEESELRRATQLLGIDGCVKFLGFRHDVSRLMNIFDVFVLSSITEGISLTLLEAMAVGKPIVATNVGGNPEVVVNEETGLLVSPKEPDVMAQAILRLLANPDLAKRMGLAGRKRVEERFSLERMTHEYIQVYKEVLGIKQKLIVSG